jgi:segregation and condensation protein B
MHARHTEGATTAMAAKRKNEPPSEPTRRSKRAASATRAASAPRDAPRAVNDSEGLSLDQLSAAFAEMLSAGADPYAPAPAVDDEEPLPPGVAPQPDRAGDATSAQADDACEISPRSIIEAILFVGSPDSEGLSSAQLAGLMRGVRPAEVDALVRELNERYSQRGASYKIVDAGKGYRLALRPDLDRVRDKFYGRVRRAKLSQSAIEVLSLVAYHEPLSTEEINRLRGVSSGAILSQLVRRELLRLERTSESRRGVYRTTPRFLSIFGLKTLADLPKSIEPPA